MFICGSNNYPNDEEEFLKAWSPSTRKSREHKTTLCRSRRKNSNNPYADRGLDKFSSLLSNLDNKRQKIYTHKSSKDISLLLFECPKPKKCKPIIVKKRNKMKENNYVESGQDDAINAAREELDQNLAWNYKRSDKWRLSVYSLMVVVILILLFLALFGRFFGILCVSLGWYLVPTIKGENWNLKRPNKKKDYVKKASIV